MATKRIHRSKYPSKSARDSAEVRIRGKRLASLGPNLVVVRVGHNTTGQALLKKADGARRLVPKVAQALDRPGIVRGSVFHRSSSSGVFAYSTYAKDPTKMIRESSSGKRVIGRLVSGKFKSE